MGIHFDDLDFRNGIRGPRASCKLGNVTVLIEHNPSEAQGGYVIKLWGVTPPDITTLFTALEIALTRRAAIDTIPD